MQEQHRISPATLPEHILLRTASIVFLLLAVALPAGAATDHTDKITAYAGSKTCRACHPEAVDEILGSIHYRMKGEVQDVYNMFTNKPEVGPQGKGNRY